jgi:MSHA pilin protein MshA
MKRDQQHGFTMIELIVVIVILGVLAAVALPRFTNMQRDARVATLNAARGAVGSASAMVYGAALARQNQLQPPCGAFGTPNVNAAGAGTVCTQSGLVNVAFLYPSAAMAGIVAASGLVQTPGVPNNAALNAAGYNAVVGGGAVQIQVLGGTAPATCSFTYTASTALGQAPQITAINNLGC